MHQLLRRFRPLRGVTFVIALSALSAVLSPAAAQDRVGPFTSPPRSVRSRDVDQQHVRLEMKVDLDKQEFAARAVHTLAPFQPLDRLTLDAAELRIDRVLLVDGRDQPSEKPLKFERHGQSLTVQLDRKYAVGEPLKIAIDYLSSKPQLGAHFVVPDQNEPDQPRMMWTQSEPEYAKYWYPCIDSPSDRVTSETIVTAKRGLLVLSNGRLKNKTAAGDDLDTWHWVQEKSHVPYLMSVVVGDFEAFEQSWDGIPVVSYVPRGRLADAPRAFEKTPRMMEFFSRKIGYRYPWPKYAQICVDEYGWGGMEHTSATTLNLRTLHDERAHLDTSSDNLVAHELAHQWWGDTLTCKDWGELWLNESFATYFATLWTEEDLGWHEAVWERHGEARSYLNEDKQVRRSIVNYRYDRPDFMFDAHAYPKGARVLHMLRFELGDDLFWRTLNRYITVNQFRNVETADLRIAVEEATGRGMNWFFDQWIYRGGHPEFEVSWEWDEAAKDAVVTVKQKQKVDDRTPLFRTSVEFELATATGEPVTRRATLSKAEETLHFTLDSRPTRVVFDPKDWILKTLVFKKSRTELLDQLARDPQVMPRVQAVLQLAEDVKEPDVAAALTKAAQTDGFWSVRLEAVKALAKTNGDAVRKTLLEIAVKDPKSAVRTEAISALGAFPHDETKAALRQMIQNEKSYPAVAQALRSLHRVDRERCEADLLAALGQESHNEVILHAAADGLVDLKSTAAAGKLTEILGQKLDPQRRVIVVAALARLKPEDAPSVDRLREQLGNERSFVRRAAIDALVSVGQPRTIAWLTEQRGKESSRGMIQSIDEAAEKLRGKSNDLGTLRKELDELRRLNRQLEERLKKLEK